MFYANGDVYVGFWEDGYLCGHGIFDSHDGTKYCGNWKNNLKDGFGIEEFAEG